MRAGQQVVAGGVAASPLLILVCGCLISLLTSACAAASACFTGPVSASHGWSREVFALAMAIQNLAWGHRPRRARPARVLAGGASLRRRPGPDGARRERQARSTSSAGVLVGAGVGGASYITVLAALGKMAPPERRHGRSASAPRVVGAVPAPRGRGQAFIATYGWEVAHSLWPGCGDRAAAGGGFAGAQPAPRACMPSPSSVSRRRCGLLSAIRATCCLLTVRLRLPARLRDDPRAVPDRPRASARRLPPERSP